MADIVNLLAAAAGAAGTGVETDPNFNQTVLLLHGDGTDGAQNNTFLDSSTNNFTITRAGNTTQGSFSPFSKQDGAWGNYFTDAGGDYFTLAADAALVPPTSSAFTVECWIYPTGSTANPIFNEVYSGGSNKVALAFNLGSAVANTSGLYPWIGFYNGSAWSGVISDVAVNANEWSHIACVFTGSAVEIYINGSAVATTGSISTWVSVVLGDGWRIGKSWTTGGELTGYLSNLRYVNGSAVYSSGFTPSGPLTAITNTVLLTCQANRFVDNSSNSFALTVVGTPKVTPFSPFAPSAAYSAATNGGSAYLDGSGDYLNLGTTSSFNFVHNTSALCTIQLWVYPTSGSGTLRWLVGTNGTASNSKGFRLYLDTNNKVVFRTTRGVSGSFGVDVTSASSVALNEWTHIAITYDISLASDDLKIYINESLDASGNQLNAATNDNAGTVLTIGDTGVATHYYFTGYISNLRIDNSVETISLPTMPVNAVTNTELLCNFTNAGIFDNTGKNNLETVGNAQIDTTVKKYGTGSMEFDGNDYIAVPQGGSSPQNISWEFGSGAFTVEFFVYVTNASAQQFFMFHGFAGSNADNYGWRVGINSSGQLDFYANGTRTFTDLVLSNNTWHHVAVCGTGGGVLNAFLDGVKSATTPTYTSIVARPTANLVLGGFTDTNEQIAQRLFMTGFLDEVRITKGVQRYSATFTPPTKAFPDL